MRVYVSITRCSTRFYLASSCRIITRTIYVRDPSLATEKHQSFQFVNKNKKQSDESHPEAENVPVFCDPKTTVWHIWFHTTASATKRNNKISLVIRFFLFLLKMMRRSKIFSFFLWWVSNLYCLFCCLCCFCSCLYVSNILYYTKSFRLLFIIKLYTFSHNNNNNNQKVLCTWNALKTKFDRKSGIWMQILNWKKVYIVMDIFASLSIVWMYLLRWIFPFAVFVTTPN